MSPVNLIPPEERRGSSAPTRTGSAVYFIVGGLALVLVAVCAVVFLGNQVSDKEAEAAQLEAQADRDRGPRRQPRLLRHLPADARRPRRDDRLARQEPLRLGARHPRALGRDPEGRLAAQPDRHRLARRPGRRLGPAIALRTVDPRSGARVGRLRPLPARHRPPDRRDARHRRRDPGHGRQRRQAEHSGRGRARRSRGRHRPRPTPPARDRRPPSSSSPPSTPSRCPPPRPLPPRPPRRRCDDHRDRRPSDTTTSESTTTDTSTTEQQSVSEADTKVKNAANLVPGG